MSKRNYSLIILMMLILTGFVDANDQIVLRSEQYIIRSIGQIRGTADVIRDKSFLGSLFDMLTGSDEKKLYKPVSVICEPDGRISILDQADGKCVLIDQTQKEYTQKTVTGANSLLDLAWYDENRLIFTESEQNRVYLYDLVSDEITEFKTDHDLMRPTGLACDPNTGNIWICETQRHQVSVFNREGRLISRFGKRGTERGEFNFPTFIRFDDQRQIYIVDSMNHRIQVFNPEMGPVSEIGSLGDGSGNLASPKGVAVDTFGHVYVADALFHNVQIFDLDGNYLEHFGKQGNGAGEFWMPTGIAIDKNNRIYVADSFNSRIQIFQFEVVK